MRLPFRNLHNPEIQANFEALEEVTDALEFPNQVASAWRSTAQNIPNSVITRVKVNKAIKDVKGNFDLANGWYVVPADGYYLCTGTVSIGNIGAGALAFAAIAVSGVEKVRGTRTVNSTGVISILTALVTGVVFCKAGDKLELTVFQSGAEAPIELGEFFPFAVIPVKAAP